ncbi:hypothetical protein MVEN_01461800 [Mycena venus]|uniref:Uncharacterized protein n=1 Tax=Mycena venus TaxID=2733690 RepID=A0A8H6XT87_9AGAR|nr:hypothetical protein MVEN_01461800 [Mycena venus]
MLCVVKDGKMKNDEARLQPLMRPQALHSLSPRLTRVSAPSRDRLLTSHFLSNSVCPVILPLFYFSFVLPSLHPPFPFRPQFPSFVSRWTLPFPLMITLHFMPSVLRPWSPSIQSSAVVIHHPHQVLTLPSHDLRFCSSI